MQQATEPEIVFDILVQSQASATDVLFSLLFTVFILLVGALYVWITCRVYRAGKPRRWRFLWLRAFPIACYSIVGVALVIAFIWTAGVYWGYWPLEYEVWLESKEYETVHGPIEDLSLQEKFWASDPNPTFRVRQKQFEYGIYSENTYLERHEEGGCLREGLRVRVYHRDGLILRMEKQPHQEGVLRDVPATSARNTPRARDPGSHQLPKTTSRRGGFPIALVIGVLFVIGVVCGVVHNCVYFFHMIPYLRRQGEPADNVVACMKFRECFNRYFELRGPQAKWLRILMSLCKYAFVLAWLIGIAAFILLAKSKQLR